MPLLPVSTTRTSTPLNTQRLLFQLNSDQIALQRQYDQLSTGRRVLRMSDDPAAAGRAVTLQRGIDRSNQLVRNAGATNAYYQSTDVALDRVTSSLIEARGVVVQGAQNVNSEDERAAFATAIRQTIQSVTAAGNSMFLDHQLLGGVLGEGQAYLFDEDSILFSGNNATGQTQVGSGAPTSLAPTGNEALGAFSVIIEGQPLNAALDRNTRLVDMRGGAGVANGVIRISDGDNWQSVDLSTAATIGDVVDVLEALDLHGRPLTATVSGDALQLEYTDGLPGTLAIADALGSQMARDLSILNADGLHAPPIVGDRLSPRVTTSTKISDLDAGTGVDLTAGIQIHQGDRVFTVDLSEAQTLGDVLIEINRSGADVRAELNEKEGRIRIRSLRSGVDYSIAENGGTAATSLGIRSATESTLLRDLGRGRGIEDNSNGDDLVITRPDGVELRIELGTAQTIEDAITLIRDHPLNQDTLRVLVSLNDFGNGLQLQAPPGVAAMRVSQEGLSNAGVRLGLIPEGQNEVLGQTIGPVNTIIGKDYLPLEAGGTLDTLLRLEIAIRDGDIPEITRLQPRLDADLDRASRTRGRVGVWAQNVDQLKSAVESELVTLQSQKSDEVDADLATVISNLTQRQTSMEASMRLIGQLSQLTVLNFL